MKKNVLKAMSVGLSAVTIASTLSVPVYADEPTTTPEPISSGTTTPAAGTTVEETKVTEKSIAGETVELNNKVNPEEGKTLAEKVGQLAVDAFDENFPDEKDGKTTYERDVIGEDGKPTGEKETVSFEQTAEEATSAADGASTDVKNAKTDTAILEYEAGQVDSTEAEAKKQLKAALDANEDIDDAVDDATTAVNVAAKSVRDTTVAISVAQEDVNAAQAAIDDADAVVEEKEAAFNTAAELYEDAEAEYEQAVIDYNQAKTDSINDVEAAEKKLQLAAAKLSELETALNDAKEAYALTAAGHILAAYDHLESEDRTKTHEYVKAILQYYVLNDESITNIIVTNTDIRDLGELKRGDACFDVVYFKNGKLITEKYGFVPAADGTLEIYTTTPKYEYEVTKEDGTKATEVITESELNAKLQNGEAVRRYELQTLSGPVYYTEEQYRYYTSLDAWYNCEYVSPEFFSKSFVILSLDGKDNRAENFVEEKRYFDKDGRYVIKGYNTETKEYSAIVNGCYYDIDKDEYLKYHSQGSAAYNSDEAVKEAALASFDAELQKKLKQITDDIKREGGFTDDKGNWIKLSKEDLANLKVETNLTKDSEGVAVIQYWTASGKYVPLYTQELTKREETTPRVKYNNIATKGKSPQQIEAEYLAEYQRQHPNEYAIRAKANYDGKGKFKDVTITFYKTKDVEWNRWYGNQACPSRDGALQAISLGVYNNTRDEWGAVTVGDYAAKIITNATYEVVAKLSATVKYHKEEKVNAKTEYNSEKAEHKYKRDQDVAEGYEEYLDDIKNHRALIIQLIEEAGTIKAEVEARQAEVEEIKRHLNELEDKTYGSAQLVEQRRKDLSDAEEALGEAKEELENDKILLGYLVAELNRRIAASQNNPGGGGESGGTGGYVYVPSAITVPTAQIIPEEEVPLAVTTPTRRTRRIAGVVEEEPVEEVVEETPAEEPEVTVEENENNPVVIDDEDVARAGGTQKSFFARTWWAWLLLVIAAIGGAVAYTKKKATDLK